MRAAGIVILILGVALAAGCRQEETVVEPYGAGDTATPPATDTLPPATDTTDTIERPNSIEVDLDEYGISMPDTIPAGRTEFLVSNDGGEEHNFEIEGQGIEQEFAQHLKPGETQTMLVDLTPGTYEIYCPVEDHADRGMRMTLTVTEEGTEASGTDL